MSVKTKYISRATVLVLLGILLMTGVGLMALPQPPVPPRLVNDFESVLTSSQLQSLEQKLVEYDNAHTTQIAIIITNDLHGYEISDFSIQLAEKWKVGSAGSENGVLITVAPESRQVFIAVGYGLEGVIPDITARRIVDNEILPAFRNNNYYQGLENATNVIMQLAAGEFAASDYNEQTESSPFAFLFPFLMIVVVVLLLSRKRNAYASPGKSIPAATLFWLLTHGSRGSKGSFGNFSSGRGGFGGGGGGFGGFGGGRFGGGGAGGSW